MKQKALIQTVLAASLGFVLLGTAGYAAPKKEAKAEKSAYVFTHVVEHKRTPVKSQARTGTCWSFATHSFVESELLRMGKPELDLSEMFTVRNAYLDKADSFIKMHGSANFGPGGQSHDVMDQFRKHGTVPESVYPGLIAGEKQHNHGELSRILQGILDAVLKRSWGDRVTPQWAKAFMAVLDIYLGEVPQEFVYEGKTYTPKTFMTDYLQFNPDDYVELTSYNHHPFHTQIRLEIPDNWSFNTGYYNLPIDEFMAVMDHALKTGYTIAWDGDVSEKDFSTKDTGYGIVPVKDWEDRSEAERNAKPTEPVAEKEIDQDMRQVSFANFSTTDDHLMHIVGLARDQKGTPFYFTKNSHGTDRKFGGYLYMSKSYVRLKTMAIMVHKDALPQELRERLIK
jgi:bleomycin hydrolase